VMTGSEAAKIATSTVLPAVKVWLLVESRISREALTRTLRRFPDIAVDGAGRDDEQQSPIVHSLCHVLVMDAWDPERLRSFRENASRDLPDCKVLLIGMDSDPDQFLAAVRAGVTGYLLKDASASEIVVAIRALVRGEAHCPPKLCLCLFENVARQRSEIPMRSGIPVSTLTLRQQKLAQLLARGFTNKEIATHLMVSEYTVRNNVHRIIRRLKVTNRREVVEAVHSLQRHSCA